MKIFAKMTLGLMMVVSVLLPTLALAQVDSYAPNLNSDGCLTVFRANKTIGNLFSYITCLIGTTVIPFLFAIAVMVFVWGGVQFIRNADDTEKREKGRDFMLWGIIGLTVMVGVWGLVSVVGRTFDVKTNVLPQVKPN